MKKYGKKTERKSLYRRVTCELHKIGLPAHIKGHNYLRTTIIKMYEDATYHGNMMKDYILMLQMSMKNKCFLCRKRN